jgi:hypothetical protein
MDANMPRQTAAPQPVARTADPNAVPAPLPPRPDSYVGMPTQKAKSSWSVDVIRGLKVEKTEVELGSEDKPTQENQE